MTAYERYCRIRDSKGFKDADVAKATGIYKSTFSDWKYGRSVPKIDKLQQDIFDDSDLRALFDAAKNSRPQDLQMAADLLRRLKDTNRDG